MRVLIKAFMGVVWMCIRTSVDQDHKDALSPSVV